MKTILKGLIRIYQLVAAYKPSPCRFSPSCSNYALEAIERHGSIKGVNLTVRRLIKCRPFGSYGSDPVPE